MKQMNAEIIAVGSELLLGQISNTNAQWISEQLANIGVNVFYHHTVGDNFTRLESVMELAKKRSDLVIVTGGLGPTDDDLTRDVAKKVLNRELIMDEEIFNKVQQYFVQNQILMTDNNRKQALVFKDSTVFPNSEGMAPGIFVEENDTAWIFLPGVPREMKAIMDEFGLAFIKKHFQLNYLIFSKVLKFIGIGESSLEDQLIDVIRNQSNPTIAPLAGDGEVTLRLTAKADSLDEAEQMISKVEKTILEKVGQYFYGTDDESIEQKVFQLLKEKNITIASAESLTGGRFIDRLISIPGASSIVAGAIVSYQSKIKQDVLAVSKNTIDNYGTVSMECAHEMAEKIHAKMQSTIGISFTGNAGPEASENKPIGKVFIGLKVGKEQIKGYEFQFNGNRETIRNRTVKKGFELLYFFLKNHF